MKRQKDKFENMEEKRKLSMDELNRLSVDQFKNAEKQPVIVVLDNVRSLNNIGSIFRTCDALGIESIYLCGITGKPPHKEIHKTALGAENSVDWVYFKSTIDAIEVLKQKGYLTYALEQTKNSKNIFSFRPKKGKKYAFIFGNEVKGVGQEVINVSDFSLEIPQFGTKHSFNVAITSAIVLWDYTTKINS